MNEKEKQQSKTITSIPKSQLLSRLSPTKPTTTTTTTSAYQQSNTSNKIIRELITDLARPKDKTLPP